MKPDYTQFVRVLKREQRPDHLPLYEHIASPGFIARATQSDFDRRPQDEVYWRTYVQFWMDMGFDVVPLEVPLNLPAPASQDGESFESEAFVVIRNVDDYEAYPWPDEENALDFSVYERVANLLPDGARLVAGVCMGPYEHVSRMLGTIGLSYLLADDPDLVQAMFDRIARLIVSVDKRLAAMDAVCAVRQGDDLGFKTATFLSPAQLRRYVFPIYAQQVQAAHDQGKPFVLHSCGQLSAVYDDLINVCKIDAKHSFEDQIMPPYEFKQLYGDRVTALGGLDVDTICRSDETHLRAYTRRMVEACFADGWWALGTGNSLTDYMPVENYRIVLDEAQRVLNG